MTMWCHMLRFVCPGMLVWTVVLGILPLGASVWAQGVLVNVNPDQAVRLPRPLVIDPGRPEPRRSPPDSYKIQQLEVQANLVDQVAKVLVSQSFVNTGSRPLEVSFIFPLPYDGAIDQLTLLVDGKEYPAKLLSAEEARRIYESIVRQNKDPALLEWMGTGMFQTSVFPVPPGAARKVTLRYVQLCRKQHGLTDFLFPMSTAKYTSHPVEKIDFRITIAASGDIKNVYSPTHSVQIERRDNRHATVTFHSQNEIPSSDFRLLYDVGSGDVGSSVISYRPKGDEDGYFLLLASPTIPAESVQPQRKTVILVVDRSGSMSGNKIEQAKGALRFVLNNLRDGDLFNLVAYDSQVESFRAELERWNAETRQAALGFVEGLYTGGSTNIDGALKTALGMLKDSNTPSYVIFLTDGLPTIGEVNETKIVENARRENRVRARLFAFGVGYDVNSRLLDKLVRVNYGQSEYVRPNEDIEASVSRLYQRIGTPVLTDVAITFDLDGGKPEDGPPVNRAYPRDQYDLFAGDQLVLVGRYRKPGNAKVTVAGSASGQMQRFDFPAELVAESRDQTNLFVEKLWAVRRVGEIIDELDLKGNNDELVKELVELATQHGILTPYTSFLADDTSNPRDVAASTGRTLERLERLAETDGLSAFSQRALKGEYQRANAVPSLSASNRFSVDGDTASNQGKKLEIHTVKNVGSKTFFLRGGRWVDSTVTAEQEKAPVTIQRFSKEYFDLVGKFGTQVTPYLALDEPLLVEVDGQAYIVE